MILHNNRELFKLMILDTSKYYGLEYAIVEKDYYVTLFLKEIFKQNQNLVFKGGTSLSKCYKAVNRFSEDIDLGIRNDVKPTEGVRRNIKKAIVSVSNSLNLDITNLEYTRSRRDFNKYIIDYNSLFQSENIKRNLIIETGVFIPIYPISYKQVTSLISDYLSETGKEDAITSFDLTGFEVPVQSIERTFIDKLFALCDYQIAGRIKEKSRHIYDLHMIYPMIKMDSNFFNLFNEVRTIRSKDIGCPSSKSKELFNNTLKEMIEKDIYKQDYKEKTYP